MDLWPDIVFAGSMMYNFVLVIKSFDYKTLFQACFLKLEHSFSPCVTYSKNKALRPWKYIS